MAGLKTRIYPLKIPLSSDEDSGWKPYHLFKGLTNDGLSLSCHASVLNPDCSPHSPHAHREEELLLLLSGEVDLILPDLKADKETIKPMKPGELVYYPSSFPHTLKTTSVYPANYLMFKWQAIEKNIDSELGYGKFNLLDKKIYGEVKDGFRHKMVFEGSTAYLHKLQCHISTLSPGAGYKPHADNYDVSVLVLDGEVKTLDESVAPHSVVFYAKGEPHEMHNTGRSFAKYVVFEFHSNEAGFFIDIFRPLYEAFFKLTSIRHVK